jgi:2,3-bisphosphoglycerate-independent phosphoglycerate mutase
VLTQDNDTIFTFNYRSDRMREIASLLAFDDEKPIDVEIPKNLVRHHAAASLTLY